MERWRVSFLGQRDIMIFCSNKVLENIAQKYENVREEMKLVMGGKILEYEAKTIKNEGLQEGMLKTLCDLVKKIDYLSKMPLLKQS